MIIQTKTLRKFLLIIVAIVFAFCNPAIFASAKDGAPLADFMGRWHSNQDAFGQSAQSTLGFEPAFGDNFVRINYEIKTGAPENRTAFFAGTAYYKHINENKFKAFWADSTGDLHPITASLNNRALVAQWGGDGPKIGRTRYELIDDNHMVVTDWILRKKEWRQFNKNTFIKQTPKPKASTSATLTAKNMEKTKGENHMEKVTGIGGIFFRAKDTKLTSQWYADNLGVDLPPKDYDTLPWQQEAGTTIFSPFDQDTEYFGNPKQQWMINFRVRDLDAIVKQLRENGNKVEIDPETYPNGRFARIMDPDGTPIQLWEPSDLVK